MRYDTFVSDTLRAVDLYDAFGLQPGSIVAAVGGGGKTSLVYALAAEAAERGESAVVVTTTRFSRPRTVEMPPVVEAAPEAIVEALRAALRPGEVVVASSGGGPDGRLIGFDAGMVEEIAGLGVGLVVAEADGAAGRPFKAPEAHEPVIPPSATHVVVCVGLEVLGARLDEERVHRPERVMALSGTGPGDAVSEDVIAAVLLHADGGRKGVPAGARLCALLNNPKTAEQEAAGARLAERLVGGGYDTAVVAFAQEPGGAVRHVAGRRWPVTRQ